MKSLGFLWNSWDLKCNLKLSLIFSYQFHCFYFFFSLVIKWWTLVMLIGSFDCWKLIFIAGKNCLHDTVDFSSLPVYVQKNLALGQSWAEGDVAFHRKIVVPTLLVHGLKDKFVSLVEMCEMERVNSFSFFKGICHSHLSGFSCISLS